MRPRTKALVAAGSGIAAGLAGLALTTLPAGADDDPVLPAIEPEALVASALAAEPQAFSGQAEVSNELGLPALPGVDALDFESARVFHDGQESARVQLEKPTSEVTFVKNPDEAWAYDSQERAARHVTWDDADAAAAREHAEAQLADPAQAAAQLIEQLRPTSEIVVDGTASVAGRAAYELVLTPKPSEKTLLREVTVAIDEQTRMPLAFDVYANGRTDPVLSLGFTELDLGAQDPTLFDFTPPQGTKVETTDASDAAGHGAGKDSAGKDKAAERMAEHSTTMVGDGWDAVVIADLPSDLPADLPADMPAGMPEGAFGGGQDLAGTLAQIGQPVSGAFGSGTHVGIAVGGAIVTDDGRVAAGAVPQQVLVDALDQQ
ncbi:sigma-E factor regulatory protein RseB domain-containing protein [Promicromonospora sukumoe]|uniref:Outer membrane lipoprotein-sorting protein n=1 Tax=Promicromonospora sukumoe TaxID=88382 RepID=A0A7W3PF49_9MICO|nr:outer membrane lipoprotein carrier protein LolA [Promicromonospora sukumoe]MBA8809715.1 outer membrane lipoprotein-sorting protein [Promicromonospora sukumoe]